MSETVKQMWESFAAAVMPKGVSDLQVQEMRRSFMGGAWAMLMKVAEIGGDAVTEETGVLRLELWKQELEQFQRDTLAGKS